MTWIILWILAGLIGIGIQIYLKMQLRNIETNTSVDISPMAAILGGPLTLIGSALRIKPIQDEIKEYLYWEQEQIRRQQDAIQKVKNGQANLKRYVTEQTAQGKLVLTRRCISSSETFGNEPPGVFSGAWSGRLGFHIDTSGSWYVEDGFLNTEQGITTLPITVVSKDFSGVTIELSPSTGKAHLYDDDGMTKTTRLQFNTSSNNVSSGQKYQLPIEFGRSQDTIFENDKVLYRYQISPIFKAFHVGYYEDDTEVDVNGKLQGQWNEGQRPRTECVFVMVYSLSKIKD